MRTGYDNFWMHQTSRYEPLPNLPKNDSHSTARLTDNSKQVQNGEYPNHLNSYILSQNNSASSQFVQPSSVYLIPLKSSYGHNFHSVGAIPIQAHNSSYSSQNSQVQQNCDFSHLRNYNANISPAYNSNSHQGGLVLTKKNDIINPPVPRIRVKDVCCLNNSTTHYPGIDSNLLQTHQKGWPEYTVNYATNNHHRTAVSETSKEYVGYKEMNIPYSSYPPSSYEHAMTKQSLNNHQQFVQHSHLIHQHIGQFSSASQFHINVNRESEKNLPVEGHKANPPSVTRQFLNHKEIQEADVHNSQVNSCHTQNGNKRVKIKPKRKLNELNNLKAVNSYLGTGTVNSTHNLTSRNINKRLIHDTLTSNNVLCSQSYHQENFSQAAQGSSFSHDFCKGDSRNSAAQNPSHKQINNNQETSVIGITLPLTGQGSFVSFNNSRSTEENSNLSLPCLSDYDDLILSHSLTEKNPTSNQINAQESELLNLLRPQSDKKSLINPGVFSQESQVCSSFNNSVQKNSNYDIENSIDKSSISVPKALPPCDQNSPLNDFEPDLNSKEIQNAFGNLNAVSEMIPQAFGSETGTKDDNVGSIETSQNETTLSNVILKQDNCFSRTKSPTTQLGENISKEVFLNTIKIEKNHDENYSEVQLKAQLQSLGSPNHLEKTLSSDVENATNIDLIKVDVKEYVYTTEKSGPKSKTVPGALKDADNFIQETKVSTDDLSKEENNLLGETKIEIQKENNQDYFPEKNYQSEINRHKLDLLIRFLKKEEETIEINVSEKEDGSPCVEETDHGNNRKEEANLNHSRRKLSKTCVVKNKNNSREMICLTSRTMSRMEMSKCSSTPPEIVQTNENSCKTEEAQSSCEEGKVMPEKLEDVSRERVKPNNSCQESGTQECGFLKSETKSYVSERKPCQEISEEYSPKINVEIQEEKNILSTLRAFQTLKTHFCMSCNLISSIESFWINVVSGELRCLNCFKKMTLKAEGNALKTKPPFPFDESKEKNIPKMDSESRSEVKENFPKYECASWESSSLKENIKQELMELLYELEKEEITIESDGSGNYSTENQKKLKMEESVNMLVKDIKTKEKVALHETCHFLKDSSGPEIKPPYEKSRRKSLTKEHNIVDQTRHLHEKTSAVRSTEMNVSKENCPVPKTLALNHLKQFSDASGKKNALKKEALSPEAKVVESFKKEERKSLDQLGRKTISKEPHICTKTQLSEGGLEKELMNQSEKSDKKGTFKEKGILEELLTKIRKKEADLSQSRNKSNSEELDFHKIPILKENPAKSKKSVDPLDKTVKKTFAKECSSCKAHAAEMLKKSRHKSSSISKETKLNEINYSDESRRKSSSAQDSLEKHKKTESIHKSKKRKNSEEDFVTHKLCIAEDRQKGEINQSSHLLDKSKAQAVKYNQNVIYPGGKRQKIGESQEENIGFEDFSKKEPKLDSSEQTKDRTNDPIGSPQKKAKEHISFKSGISKDYAKTETKNGNRDAVDKDKKMEETEKKFLLEKIFKIPRKGEEEKNRALIKSPFCDRPQDPSFVDSMPKCLKEKQNTKTRPHENFEKDSPESGRKPSKKKDEKHGQKASKKSGENEFFHRRPGMKYKKESETSSAKKNFFRTFGKKKMW